MKKTQARLIMEARNVSYAVKPSGYMDETDLLLWSQDVAERRAAAAKKRKSKKMPTKHR